MHTAPNTTDCLFCKIVAGEIPSYTVYEDDETLAFLDINPVSKRHTLVIPKNHCKNMQDVSEADAVAVMKTVRKVVHMYREQCGIEHVNVLNNTGAAAQQEVFHLHYHIIPRAENDGLYHKRPTKPELREQFGEMIDGLHRDI